jgi:hypothetical protein
MKLLITGLMLAAFVVGAHANTNPNEYISPEELNPGPKPASYCLHYGRNGLCQQFQIVSQTTLSRTWF